MSENTMFINEIENSYDAFECFKQRFLVERKSIFRLDSNEEILTTESVQYLVDNFINNGFAGNASFIDKIRMQLVGEKKINQKSNEKPLKF